MAQAGIGSRRHNEQLIRDGQVTVNGRIARLGEKANPKNDKISVNGEPIQLETSYLYIALNKPKGIISSLEDELNEDRQTVRDLVNLPGHLYPVGRLDKQSEGLILMTNDGQLAHKLTHPRYGHRKVYEVILADDVDEANIERWQKGIYLDDKKTAPAQVTITKRNKNSTQLRIVMREGRKRQIRRVAAQFGHVVLKLTRSQIGPLKLGNLPAGQWRHLSQDEVQKLKKSVQAGRPSNNNKRSNYKRSKRPYKK